MIYLHDMIGTHDVQTSLYGSKAANLGRLLSQGYNVPNGIVFGPDDDFENISIPGMLSNINLMSRTRLMGVTDTWAVRSSGLAEDGADTSYAGQHDTFLSVLPDNILTRIQDCRDSSVKAEAYREARGEDNQGIAVLVQQMVPAEVAGVTFTSDPFNMNLGTSVIEYTYGLGDKLVAGEVNPVGSHEVDNGTREFVPSIEDDHYRQRLKMVHTLCQDIAQLFGAPMDIEWAIDSHGMVWILQARPLTTGGRAWNYPEFVGRSVVKGRAEGVAIWADKDEPLNTAFAEGNILLAVMTNPHMVPLMMQSSGIATQIGGRTCHAAIVSRELNKPCVVGIGNLSVLYNNTPIVLDATEGRVRA
jgi:pyruvate,water dikinase